MVLKDSDVAATGVQGERETGIMINHLLCDQCGVCVGVCPGLALVLSRCGLAWESENCTGCLDCVTSCPLGALQEK